MDSSITAAARALRGGDPLGALKRVALRDDPPALALRGIAMARLGEYARARELLRRAARGFGAHEVRARARCVVAEAEVALAMRDLRGSPRALAAAAATLEARDDRANALQARLIAVRRLLLLGRLEEAASCLGRPDARGLPPSLRAVAELLEAELALRSLRTTPAREALARARAAAELARVPALHAEVDEAHAALDPVRRQRGMAPASGVDDEHLERRIVLPEDRLDGMPRDDPRPPRRHSARPWQRGTRPAESCEQDVPTPREERRDQAHDKGDRDRDPGAAGVVRREQDPDARDGLAHHGVLDVLLRRQQDQLEDGDPRRKPEERTEQRPARQLSSRRLVCRRRRRRRAGKDTQPVEPCEPEPDEARGEEEAGEHGRVPRVTVAGVDERLAIQRAVAREVDELVREHERTQLQHAGGREAAESWRHRRHSTPTGEYTSTAN